MAYCVNLQCVGLCPSSNQPPRDRLHQPRATWTIPVQADPGTVYVTCGRVSSGCRHLFQCHGQHGEVSEFTQIERPKIVSEMFLWNHSTSEYQEMGFEGALWYLKQQTPCLSSRARRSSTPPRGRYTDTHAISPSLPIAHISVFRWGNGARTQE